MLAQQCDLGVGEIVITMSDAHIYLNHLEQVKLQLTRDPKPLPKLKIKRKPDSIYDYSFEDFELKGTSRTRLSQRRSQSDVMAGLDSNLLSFSPVWH